MEIKKHRLSEFLMLEENEIRNFSLYEQEFADQPWLQRAKQWVEKAAGFNELAPMITHDVKQSVVEFQTKQQNLIRDPLSFDVDIINKVTPKLGKISNAGAVTPFAHYASTLINDYAIQAQAMGQQVRIINPQWVSASQLLSNQLSQAAQTVSNLSTSNNEFNANKVTQLLSSVKTSLQSITTSFAKAEPKDIIDLGTTLFTEVTKVSGKHLEVKREIQSVITQLGDLMKDPQANKLAIVQGEIKLKGLQAREIKEQTEFSRTLQGMGQGFNLVGSILSATGHAKLGKQITTIGQAGVDIVKTIVNFGAMAAASGPLAPLMAIGGAATVLFNALSSLFGDQGPTPEEQLSQQISQLAEHMDERFNRIEEQIKAGVQAIQQSILQLGQHLDRRFDRLENMLGAIHKEMHGRFDRLETMLGQFYSDVIKGMVDLKEGIHDIKQGIEKLQRTANHIKHQMGELERALLDYLISIHKMDYRKLRTKAFETLPAQRQHKDVSAKAEACAKQFIHWAVIEAKERTLSGEVPHNLTEATLCQKIHDSTKGFAYNINLLAAYAEGHFNIQINKHETQFERKTNNLTQGLANPILWANAAFNYLRFLRVTPELKLSEDHSTHIDDLIKVGKEINNFVLDVRTNAKLFQTLCENYRDNLLNVLFLFYDFILSENTLNRILGPDRRIFALFDEHWNRDKLNDVPIKDVLAKVEAWKSLDQLNRLTRKAEAQFPGLLSNRGYVRYVAADDLPERILIPLLRHMAASEKDRAQRANKLPDIELMEQFFVVMMQYQDTLADMSCDQIHSNQAIKNALKKLNESYQLLDVFIAFAFSEDYNEDSELYTSLKIKLWKNDKDIHENIQHVTYHNNEPFLLFMQKNVFPVIDNLEMILLEKSIEADLKKGHNEKQSLYLLVDDVIERLETFRSIYLSNELISVNQQLLTSDGKPLWEKKPADDSRYKAIRKKQETKEEQVEKQPEEEVRISEDEELALAISMSWNDK